jgi:hypothetical protein
VESCSSLEVPVATCRSIYRQSNAFEPILKGLSLLVAARGVSSRCQEGTVANRRSVRCTARQLGQLYVATPPLKSKTGIPAHCSNIHHYPLVTRVAPMPNRLPRAYQSSLIKRKCTRESDCFTCDSTDPLIPVNL